MTKRGHLWVQVAMNMPASPKSGPNCVKNAMEWCQHCGCLAIVDTFYRKPDQWDVREYRPVGARSWKKTKEPPCK